LTDRVSVVYNSFSQAPACAHPHLRLTGDMSNNVAAFLKENKAKIDRFILTALPAKDPVPEVELLFTMMREYPQRSGKGLRPGLCLLTCRSFGGDSDKALTTAGALELFQNWIVIHDDIEDDSELRRGSPALHVQYNTPLAINAGDALAGKMWEVLLRNHEILGPQKSFAILREFSVMLGKTTSGQHIELSWVNDDRWDLTEGDYLLMCRNKTAWYTVVAPMRLGAIIADGPEEALTMMVDLGLKLGVAFQIQDDVLNLVGSEEKYGKEIGGDIQEGKRTLITIHLHNHAEEAERSEIRSIMSKPRQDKTPEEVQRILRLMHSHGSIEYASDFAHRLAAEAKEMLKKLPFNGDPRYQEMLGELVDFVVCREL
jgi:geranylgeranyl diphosphate synthase type II